ncbi:hypothetical protein [Streptomyces sp. NPDC001743]
MSGTAVPQGVSFRAQLNEVLRTELPATALAPLHPAAQTRREA